MLLASGTAGARIWHIAPDGGGDLPTIQAALTAAVAGDEIVLAPGTYSWTTQGESPQRGSMLWIDKAITLRGSGGAAHTILDAERRGRVALCAGAPTLRDLTIRGGRAPTGYPGGGLRVIHGGLVAQCVITDNECVGTGSGGGLVMIDGGIEDCEIVANQVAARGRGAGASLLRARMSRCIVRDNTAAGEGGSGGGLYSVDSVIEDSRFTANRVIGLLAAVGGAIHSTGDRIERCVFTRNVLYSGDSQGGAVYGTPAAVIECVFIANATPGTRSTGGALYGVATVAVERCTFVGNTSGVHNADVHRSIIAGCSVGPPCAGTGSVACSDLFANPTTRGGCAEQAGNMSLDPEFCAVDPRTSEDVSLQSDSPCLQAACGAIGARAVAGCDAVAVMPVAWSAVKQIYRAATAP
jgi:hypothetical protein